MIFKWLKYSFLLFLFLYVGSSADAQSRVDFSGTVCDADTREVLPYATVLLQGAGQYAAVADENGFFRLTAVKVGIYQLTVSYIGYTRRQQQMDLFKSVRLSVELHSDNRLKEVVVTATESRGVVTASQIDRPAMQHLQPTSFADLMELLPGGMSRDPNMGTANAITLRETGVIRADGSKGGVSSDYAITSLGTQFVVDGIPMNTDAELQASPVADGNLAEQRRNMVNRGVDMRTLSTDDIESVEVVRGIPSAEYGNLTSGLVNIKKIRKLTPLNARFKADGYSKLLAAGKGFALPDEAEGVVNVDVGYMDSKPDPRNNLENYKRMNASLRFTWNFVREHWSMRYAPGVEYIGSFDNAKEDPELNYGNIDTYKSSYNRMAFTNNLQWKFPQKRNIRGVDLNTAIQAQFDRLERRKLVAPQRYMLVPASVGEGEHDATLLFKEYIADFLSDGKPFNAFLKLKGDFCFQHTVWKHQIKAGAEWNYTKNFGRGQVYDLSRPLVAGGWSSRPRAYRDIPALQNLGFFVEDVLTAQWGGHRLELMGGVRSQTLVGIDARYVLNGRFYFDPRLNGLWSFPKMKIGMKYLQVAVGGGVGWTTKMPTLSYLFPDKYYNDIVQLGYYDPVKPAQNSRFNIRSYISDRTNYGLKPARNRKWELRFDLNYGENRLSVNYFRETMHSGFRYMSFYAPYSYKLYDASGISSSALLGPPSLDGLPFTEKTTLDGYARAANGSKLLKEGIEFQFRSQRIRPLRTVVHLNGAWFRSTYSNSMRMMRAVSDVVDGQPVSDLYMGIYNWDDGYVYQQFNTNLLLDTQVPEWGLVFSTSLQCMWFTSKQALYREGRPEAYLSASDGLEHLYTDVSAKDVYLKHLLVAISPGTFEKYTVPMAFFVNLKATKKIGKYLQLAFFANKLLDYTPDFTSSGQVVRRNVDPYFGMELNFSL